MQCLNTSSLTYVPACLQLQQTVCLLGQPEASSPASICRETAGALP